MAEGDGAIFNNFKEQVMEEFFNLSTGADTLQLSLHVAEAPNIDSDIDYGDVSATEYAQASGYITKGKTLAGQDTTQDNGNDRGVFDATSPTWSSLGPLDTATPSDAILWDETAAGDELICYWELGTTATNGGDYTLDFGATGIILLT
jgi:hypothetical protein